LSPLSKAALIAVALALAGCKDINDGLALLEGKPTADEAIDMIEARYTVLDGTGPMGEVLAEGPDCHNSFRTQICMDQPSPYPWWPTNADAQ
jgi:hypothetical protein